MIHNHHIQMFFIMLIAGALSTMNVWVSSLDDLSFSLNDLYMILLMSGWMLLFTGFFERNSTLILVGGLLTLVSFVAIRTQFLITERQWILGMIPHHSMAIFMSEKLLARGDGRVMTELAKEIIKGQRSEIDFMKQKFV